MDSDGPAWLQAKDSDILGCVERSPGELVAAEDVLPFLQAVFRGSATVDEGLARDCASRMVRRARSNGRLEGPTSDSPALTDMVGDALVLLARKQEEVREWDASPDELAFRTLADVRVGSLSPATQRDCRGLLGALCSRALDFTGRSDSAFEARYKAYVAATHGKLAVYGLDSAYTPNELPLEIAHVTTIDRAFKGSPRVVLRGEVGSGKSTVLRWLAVRSAQLDLEVAGDRLSLVPFLFPLVRRGAMPMPSQFLSAVRCPFDFEQPEHWVTRILVEGRGLVLLDGLDEVDASERRLVLTWLADMCGAYPGNRWILSSRAPVIPEGFLEGFTDVVLPPLGAHGKDAFVRGWYRARLATGADEAENRAYERSLLQLLRTRADVSSLAVNPLMCAMLCALNVNHRGTLPGDRTALYSAFFGMLVRRDAERGIGPPTSGLAEGHQYAFLGRLACWMLRNGTTEMSVEAAVSQIAPVLPSMPSVAADSGPEEVLSYLLGRSGVLHSPAHGTVAFIHRTFRDFLAARTMVVEDSLLELLRHANDDSWRDALLSAVGLARPRERALILTVLVERGDAEQERSAALRLYLLAASCLAEAREVEPSARQAVMDRIADHLPPRTAEEAAAFAALGPAVLPLVPDPAALSRTDNRAFLDVLVRIPGPQAEAAVRRHFLRSRPPFPAALRQLPEPAPGARELAVALSVATRIEPELIRAVRLRVFPLLDAGDEADLWFSAWAAARTPSAMALRPELLPVLRAELAERVATAGPGDTILRLGEIVAEVHERLSPALYVEERLNWLDVTGRLVFQDGEEIVGKLLSPALRALVEERREGVADWLSGAWSRLPEAARETVRAWQLVTAAAQQVPDAGLEQAPAPPEVTAADVALIVESVGDAVLTVARGRGTLTLSAGAGTAQDTGILVPDTDPRVVEVLADEGGTEHATRTVTVPVGEARTVTVGDGPVRLRTPRGDVYELASAPEPEAAAPESTSMPDGFVEEETWVGRVFHAPAGRLADPDVLGRVEREVRAVRASSPEGPLDRGELGQWRHAVSALAWLLVEAGLRDVEVIIGRYAGPGDEATDVTLAGENPATGGLSYVLVELRGWRGLHLHQADARLCRPGLKAARVEIHPVERARSRWEQLVATHAVLNRNPASLEAMVFLPQANDTEVDRTPPPLDEPRAWLFTADQRTEMREYLKSRLGPGPGAPAAEALLSGHLLPRRTVLQAAADFAVRPPFYALGGQSAVLGHAMSALRGGDRRVVVVSGAAGTGKTALALMLLHEARRTHPSTMYVSGLRDLTSRLRLALSGDRRETADWVRFPFHVPSPDVRDSRAPARLPMLVCDDAQLTRPKSNGRYIPKAERSEQPEIERLLDAADITVFLVDEGMTWSHDHVGSVERILRCARDKGMPTVHVELRNSLRFGGSPAYPRWVSALLGQDGTDTAAWRPDSRYHVLAASDPEEMETFLRGRLAEGETARMTAGLCWPWSVPASEEEQARGEVVVGGWRRSWHAPTPAGRWAAEASGFEQVGTIHGAAGFEFDWCGVVLGPDFVYRDGRWTTQRRANNSTQLAGRRVSDAEADRLIRNAYRILLTRAVKGVVVCSADPESRQELQRLLPETAFGPMRRVGP